MQTKCASDREANGISRSHKPTYMFIESRAVNAVIELHGGFQLPPFLQHANKINVVNPQVLDGI